MRNQLEELMPLEEALEHVVFCKYAGDEDLEQAAAQRICFTQPQAQTAPRHDMVEHSGSD